VGNITNAVLARLDGGPFPPLTAYTELIQPGRRHRVGVRAGDDLQVHPVSVVLAGIKRPVSGHPVDRD